jgi:uncharacterized tellurite resistance protein B-like protein
MPVIILIVSTLAFWLIYWFIRMDGLEHIAGTFDARRREAQRLKSREAQRIAPLKAVDDPRDAATILMLLIARINHDPTREHIAAIENTVRSVFGFDRDLTERMTQARFIASRADNFDQAAGVFADMLNKRLTADERLHLIDMLGDVARIEGPTEAQTEAMESLKRRLGLVKTH